MHGHSRNGFDFSIKLVKWKMNYYPVKINKKRLKQLQKEMQAYNKKQRIQGIAYYEIPNYAMLLVNLCGLFFVWYMLPFIPKEGSSATVLTLGVIIITVLLVIRILFNQPVRSWLEDAINILEGLNK